MTKMYKMFVFILDDWSYDPAVAPIPRDLEDRHKHTSVRILIPRKGLQRNV